MIANAVFVCGKGLLAHPVSYLFHLPSDAGRGAPNQAALGDRRLVLVDCRLHAAQDVAVWVSDSLAHRLPVLLLCPSADTLSALKGRVGILPDVPGAAMLIAARENSCGLTNFEVSTLEYTLVPVGIQSLTDPDAAGHEAPEIECACTEFAELSNVFVPPEAVDAFKIRVERAMDGEFAAGPQQNSPPNAVKHFFHIITQISPFTYSSDGVTNGAGALNFTWMVWGFLSQSEKGNSQYLSVEGAISLSSGKLANNDQCKRGFGNANLSVTLTAPMSYWGSAPTGGGGNFTGTVAFPVSYKRETGGYLTWNYSASVNNAVTSWVCKSLSSGPSLGNMWYMIEPCNGSNLDKDWKKAFTFWHHVKDFTAASNGTLPVNTVYAWYTNNLLNGLVTLDVDSEWQCIRFWGVGRSINSYLSGTAESGTYTWRPRFGVDFSPINPS